MLWNYLTLLNELHWGDLLDIGIAALLIWLGFHALRTERTRRIGVGLLSYSAVMLVANQLELSLTVWLLQGITAVIILVVVVVYQTEIRRLLERFPASLFSRNRISYAETNGLADLLTQVLGDLAAQKTGALIVLPGQVALESIITPGIPLDGRLSRALLLSLFDSSSPGHDGALLVKGERVERFGSRLPLSDRDDQLKERGTRHAAALGLAEKSDALVLVVSEESGRISMARDGRLFSIEANALHREIEAFLKRHALPDENDGRLKSFAVGTLLEGLAALTVAAVLWLVLVPGSVVQTATYEVAVEVQNIPEGFVLAGVTPPTIAVTLSGEKRNLFKINPDELLIRLDGTLTRFGRQTYPITSSHLTLPPNVEVSDLTPDQARVLVRKQN